MRKPLLFVIVLITGMAALIGTLLWYASVYQAGNSSLTGMMNQMMGGSQPIGSALAMPWYVWAFVVGFVLIVALGLTGVAYYIIYPEIQHSSIPVSSSPRITPDTSVAISTGINKNKSSVASWPVLIKTSKPDERKILEVLAAHDGKYLQKFIVKESGLSKLKTHRILSRFAERGIVTATKSGNTNEIALADWAHQRSTSN